MHNFSNAMAAALLTLSAVPAAALQQPSVQAQFEAASDALSAQKWAEALRIFEALEKRLAQGNQRSLGIVRVRKAEALLRLDRDAEARRALELGLAALPETDPSLLEDRYLGLVALGRLDERALDYRGALAHYRAADALPLPPAAKLEALRGLIVTQMFHDSAAALREADRVLALLASEPEASEKLIGQFRTLKGRVLLNQKRFAEARTELDAATEALGGLTRMVDAADIAARSDQAIAALLAGREEEARKLLAYSGSGRLPSDFSPGAEMPPPPCGEAGGLRPDDVAVVEFSIRDDGTIGHVAPIYSSRGGEVALAFARAAADWSWSPQELQDIPPLLRMLTRVEMRCSMAIDQPSPIEILRADLDAWAAERRLPPVTIGAASDAARVAPLQAELAARERRYGAQAPELLPVLIELAENAVVDHEPTAAYLRRAEAIARAANAPAPVLAHLGMRAATAEKQRDFDQEPKKLPDFARLLADPVIQRDARALTAVRLAEAENRYKIAKQRDYAIELLERVRDSSGLGANDPLRAAALVRLASLQFADGNQQAALTSYAQSGLSAEQCALLDAEPRMKRMNVSSNDFPEEAQRWGFEGWTALEHDIDAKGQTQNVRATLSYPPFVFTEAGREIVENVEYEPSFRPDGGLGCGGNTMRIVFRLPD